MTTGALDPRIAEKIAAFGRRRRRLLCARGACALFALLLGAMSAVALLDRAAALAEPVRLALGAGAYAAALAGGWWLAGRWVWRGEDVRKLARLFEETKPELREQLLSAVELAGAGSNAFLDAVQEDVAGRLRECHVERMLAWTRIRRWVAAAGAAAAAALTLACVPGLHYPGFLLRSLLPMANLERPSTVRVAIVEPAPPDRAVAASEPVRVRVRTSEAPEGGAFLEVFPGDGPAERLRMSPAGENEFVAEIRVARAPLEYRAGAGDGLTRRHLLVPVPRPSERRFRKIYQFPEYLARPAAERLEERGDLEAPEGTQVTLEIETDLQVRGGEMIVEAQGQSSTRRLEWLAPTKLRARLAVHHPGSYRLVLFSEREEIARSPGPKYEIRPVPDLVPRVVLEEPEGDRTVRPTDVVRVRGKAEDDFGLKGVFLAFKVNDRPWEEVPLAPGGIDHAWDLLGLGLAGGDRVALKLAAVDGKGTRGESNGVLLTVSRQGVEPRRVEALSARRALLEALGRWREEVRSGDPNRAAREVEVVDALAREAARRARPGREADDIIQVGALACRLRATPAADGPAVTRAEAAFARLVGAEELAEAAIALAGLAFELRRLSGMPDAALRVRGLAAAVAGIEELLGADLKDEVARLRQEMEAGRVPEVPKALVDRLDALRAASSVPQARAALREVAGRASGAVADAALSARARLEEARPDSDAAFVSDLSLARRALNAAGPRALGTIERALRTLEAGHALAEVEASLRALETAERWPESAGDLPVRHPEDWAWLEESVEILTPGFRGAGLCPDLLKELIETPRADELRGEMARRRGGEVPRASGDAFGEVARAAAEVLAGIGPDLEKARRDLAALAPSLEERLGTLAEKVEALRRDTRRTGELSPRLGPDATRSEAGGLLGRQAGVNGEVEEVVAEYRREANRQDLLTPAGRERARDADIAVALLRQAPPRAHASLAEAAGGRETAAQQAALGKAEGHQGEMLDALRLLAEHEKALAAGDPSATRAKLREWEERLGLKAEHEAKYGVMERLAALAAQPGNEELLRAMAEDEEVRRQLEALARNNLAQALEKLEEAAETDRALAALLEQLAAQSPSPASLQEQMRGLSAGIANLGQQLSSLQAQAPSAPLQSAASWVQSAAQSVPSSPAQPAQALAGRLNQAAQHLLQAQAQLQSPAQAAHQAAQQAAASARQAAQSAQTPKAAAAAKQAAAHAAQAQQSAAQAQASQQQGQMAQAQAHAAAAQNAAQQAAAQARLAGAPSAPPAGSSQAASQAGQLARQAQQMAASLSSSASALSQSAQQQGAVTSSLQGAQSQIAQAARGMAALGASSQAQALQQVAQGVSGSAVPQSAKAQQALATSSSPGQASPAVSAAQSAIQQQAQALKQAQGSSGSSPKAAAASGKSASSGPPKSSGAPSGGSSGSSPKAAASSGSSGKSSSSGSPGAPGTPSGGSSGSSSSGAKAAGTPGSSGKGSSGGLSQGAARLMAQALQGAGGGPPGSGPSAAGSAARAQAASTRQGRNASSTASASTGSGPGGGSPFGPTGSGSFLSGTGLSSADWGKLPPEVARDLLESRRESVAPEYRERVEAYFRLLAERAVEER